MNRNSIFYFTVIAVASMLLASCIKPPAQDKTFKTAPLLQNQRNQKTYVYECSNEFTFTTRVDDENAYLFLADKTACLANVPSASGVKYSNGLITFWSKGEEALLDTGDTIYRNCKNNRTKAIWEDAKLDGIDFRAVGNEPGWYLEIKGGVTKSDLSAIMDRIDMNLLHLNRKLINRPVLPLIQPIMMQIS